MYIKVGCIEYITLFKEKVEDEKGYRNQGEKSKKKEENSKGIKNSIINSFIITTNFIYCFQSNI